MNITALTLTALTLAYIVLFLSIYFPAQVKPATSLATAAAALRRLTVWEMIFLNGLPLFTDLFAALENAAATGKVLELTYRDASGAFHTRTVELWGYDAELQTLRTREVGTCHFRQVIAPLVVSVRWVGDYSTAAAPLRTDADAIAALALVAA